MNIKDLFNPLFVIFYFMLYLISYLLWNMIFYNYSFEEKFIGFFLILVLSSIFIKLMIDFSEEYIEVLK